MGHDEGDRGFGVEVPVEQQAHWWHNRCVCMGLVLWTEGGDGVGQLLCVVVGGVGTECFCCQSC